MSAVHSTETEVARKSASVRLCFYEFNSFKNRLDAFWAKDMSRPIILQVQVSNYLVHLAEIAWTGLIGRGKERE